MNRKLGLQSKWRYVVDSLNSIVSSYEKASSRISLFMDRRMREMVLSDVRSGMFILDMGSGPGTLSKLVAKKRANSVLLDISRNMLSVSGFEDRVQGTFEHMPFRDKAFDGVLSAFAFRDAYDTIKTLSEVKRVLKGNGFFSFCDLGKPDSTLSMLAVAIYIRIFPALIGMLSQGKKGLSYGSLFPTYVLLPRNSSLERILGLFFKSVKMEEMMMGGAVIFRCKL